MLLQINEPSHYPQVKSKSVAIGIDLGTTNSVVAIVDDGIPRILTLEGHSFTPCVVFYGASTQIGHQALKSISESPEKGVQSVKRLMGQQWKNVHNKSLPFEFVNIIPNSDIQDFKDLAFKAGETILNPIQVSSTLLRYLKEQAEITLGHPVEKAVITVPAHFTEVARGATRQAAKDAGLEVLRLVAEPTAAALAYGLDEGSEGLYVVYDLGGGTFDISLLRLQRGIFQVLAVGGDCFLGGDDMDQILLEHFQIPKSSGTHNQDLVWAKSIKEHLSTQSSWSGFYKDKPYEITKKTFESLIDSFVSRTLDICQDVLTTITSTEKIQQIVLVGGVTRIPYIQEKIKTFFNQDVLCTLNPEEVVALGASLQASSLTTGQGKLLLDVLPLSVGIETMGGFSERIIDRNTPIPCSATKEYTTYYDNQESISIHVIQGEREMSQDCQSLATCIVHDLPPLPAGSLRLAITFTIDADGLLSVQAQEKTSGLKQEIQINPFYNLSYDKTLDILRDGFYNAEIDLKTRHLKELEIKAKLLGNQLESIKSLYKLNLENYHIKQLTAFLENLNKAIIDQEPDDLEKIMDSIEQDVQPLLEIILKNNLDPSEV